MCTLDKTQAQYEELFSAVLRKCESLGFGVDLSSIVCDFELATINAVVSVWVNTCPSEAASTIHAIYVRGGGFRNWALRRPTKRTTPSDTCVVCSTLSPFYQSTTYRMNFGTSRKRYLMESTGWHLRVW